MNFNFYKSFALLFILVLNFNSATAFWGNLFSKDNWKTTATIGALGVSGVANLYLGYLLKKRSARKPAECSDNCPSLNNYMRIKMAIEKKGFKVEEEGKNPAVFVRLSGDKKNKPLDAISSSDNCRSCFTYKIEFENLMSAVISKKVRVEEQESMPRQFKVTLPS